MFITGYIHGTTALQISLFIQTKGSFFPSLKSNTFFISKVKNEGVFVENMLYLATFLELCSMEGASSQCPRRKRKEKRERWFTTIICMFLFPSTIKKTNLNV